MHRVCGPHVTSAGRTQRHARRKAGLAALVGDSQAAGGILHNPPRKHPPLSDEQPSSEEEGLSTDGSFHAVNATHVARTQLALSQLSVRDRLQQADKGK